MRPQRSGNCKFRKKADDFFVTLRTRLEFFLHVAGIVWEEGRLALGKPSSPDLTSHTAIVITGGKKQKSNNLKRKPSLTLRGEDMWTVSSVQTIYTHHSRGLARTVPEPFLTAADTWFHTDQAPTEGQAGGRKTGGNQWTFHVLGLKTDNEISPRASERVVKVE